MGSQIAFEGSSTMVEIRRRRGPIIETLKEKFVEEEECGKNWRAPIKEVLLSEGTIEGLKSVMKRELL